MLQNLRDHIHGWIAGLISAVLVLAFALWGIQYYLGGSGTSPVIAKINGETITQDQLDAAYQRLRQQQMQQADTASIVLSQTAQQQLKLQLLQQLIEKQALVHAASNAGYSVSPEVLNAVMLQIPAFQYNGQFSTQRYQQVLNATLYTPQQFADDLSQSLLVTQVQAGMAESEFSLPNEVDALIKFSDQKRDMGYFIIPAQRFLANAIINPADIQNYYDAHKNNFMTQEQVSIQYIELSATQLAAKLKTSDQEIQQYYQNNIGNFTTPEQWQVAQIVINLPANADTKTQQAAQDRINAIAKQIKAGKDFAELAQQFSEDKATAAKGGVTGWFNQNQQSPIFMQIISGLQPNQVSAPFQTATGYNIIKLVAVKKAQVLALSAVHDQIAKTIQQQKVEQAFSDQSDKLTNLTYTNPDTLKVAADALNLPIQTTSFFTQAGTKSGITTNPKIVVAAFSENVLKQNNNSDPIQIDDGTWIVLRVNQHKPAAIPPLAQLKEQIATQLKLQAAQNAAKDLGQKALADLQKGISPEQVAKKYELAWHYQANISRDQSDMNAQILRAAFGLAKPLTASKFSATSVSIPNGDYAVVAINGIEEGDASKFTAQQRSVFQNELANDWGQLDYSLYVNAVKQHARVKIEQQPQTE